MVITVFGSGRCKAESPEYRLAHTLGAELAKAGYTVCNGGYDGVMAATAKGAREAGGTAIGITVESFRRPANPWIGKEIRTKSLFERMVKLIDVGDGFAVLRGGTGTLLEFSAAWELLNKDMIANKPLMVLSPFWSPLVRMMREELTSEGLDFAAQLPVEVSTPAECVEQLALRLS